MIENGDVKVSAFPSHSGWHLEREVDFYTPLGSRSLVRSWEEYLLPQDSRVLKLLKIHRLPFDCTTGLHIQELSERSWLVRLVWVGRYVMSTFSLSVFIGDNLLWVKDPSMTPARRDSSIERILNMHMTDKWRAPALRLRDLVSLDCIDKFRKA